MFTVTEGNTQGPADADEFIELINEPPAELRDFFDQAADIFISRAPGRLDVMGGIADYSGSLVLEMPIAEATFAAVQKTDGARITIASFHPAEDEILAFEMDVGDLAIVDNARYYDEAKEFFLRDRSRHWAGYVAGVFFVLRHELGVDFENGARILIASRVPVGKGVSSSAALEVATMQAVCSAFRIEIDPLKSAKVCQTIENLIVGAPCGVMDQVASHCGVQSALISVLCQPAVIQATIRIPEGIELWGIDSGVPHAVSDSDYARVRMGAFMGYRIIAEMAGLKVRSIGQNIVEIADCRWHGYLANLSPSECERSFAAGLPNEISGKEFLERYNGTTDQMTKIDPAATYAVRVSTEFPIYENDRVEQFSRILQADDADEHLDLLGRLMFDSHAGYAACGLTEPGTDRLVELVRENHKNGLFGARITGGGSGGTVAIVGRRGCRSVVDDIASRYQNETGRTTYVFAGSSPGCDEFGSIVLRRADQDRAARRHNLPSGSV